MEKLLKLLLASALLTVAVGLYLLGAYFSKAANWTTDPPVATRRTMPG